MVRMKNLTKLYKIKLDVQQTKQKLGIHGQL